MCNFVKVLLLLAVMICEVQMAIPELKCLCQRVRNRFPPRSEIKDIQIYPATLFCDTVEIVVTTNSGLRYCMNPESKTVKRLMENTLRRQSRHPATTQTTQLETLASTTSTSSQGENGAILPQPKQSGLQLSIAPTQMDLGIWWHL